MLEHSRQKNLLISYVLSKFAVIQEESNTGTESLGWQEVRKPLVQKIERLNGTTSGETITQVPSEKNTAEKRKNLGTWLTKSIGHKKVEKILQEVKRMWVTLAVICRTYRNLSHILRGCSLYMKGLLQKCNRQTRSRRIEGIHWEVVYLAINICIC